ncbi:hypothetical protein FQA39_LY04646 [Lamprigera yunnana]|nr:hypothetical protein FQA39_LY04646 [Lamprigera yunnana]
MQSCFFFGGYFKNKRSNKLNETQHVKANLAQHSTLFNGFIDDSNVSYFQTSQCLIKKMDLRRHLQKSNSQKYLTTWMRAKMSLEIFQTRTAIVDPDYAPEVVPEYIPEAGLSDENNLQEFEDAFSGDEIEEQPSTSKNSVSKDKGKSKQL